MICSNPPASIPTNPFNSTLVEYPRLGDWETVYHFLRDSSSFFSLLWVPQHPLAILSITRLHILFLPLSYLKYLFALYSLSLFSYFSPPEKVKSASVSYSVLSNSLWPHELWPHLSHQRVNSLAQTIVYLFCNLRNYQSKFFPPNRWMSECMCSPSVKEAVGLQFPFGV